MEQEFFDIESLNTNFKAALRDETDIAMDFYLEGFKELCKYDLNWAIDFLFVWLTVFVLCLDFFT